jgi:hypothetical protein
MHQLLASIAIAFLYTPAFAQGTWYVDVHATGPGDGSAAHPYVSIQAAISNPATHTADTIRVAPGTYVEDVSIMNVGVYVVATGGPALTTIQGSASVDGLYTSSGPAELEGFTIASPLGAFVVSGTLRRCIVVSPAGLPPGARGIFYDDFSHLDHCVVTGFQLGLDMFAFASIPVDVRNTVFSGNSLTLYSSASADFLNCCFPSLPQGGGISSVGALIGDPGFWDAAHGDFHLAPLSNCIATDIGAIPYDAGYATGPAVYCSTSPASDGCSASISASGTCSLSGTAPFWVTAEHVMPNKLGRLLYSLGEANVPFQGGVLCLATPLRRTAPSNSGSSGTPPCTGVLSYDFHALVQSGADPLLQPGRVVYAQYRFRDPFSPGGYAVAFSDAVRFGIAP